MPPSKKREMPLTLPFEKFWAWLQVHPNCILRAGTPETVVMDDDDLHWHFLVEEDGTHVIQVIRGKHTLAEIAVHAPDVAYVEVAEDAETEETDFTLIQETERERIAAYHFILSHGFDKEDLPAPNRWTH
jgi:hypothetical protein